MRIIIGDSTKPPERLSKGSRFLRSEFKSANDWKQFSDYLRRSNRYVLNDRWQYFAKLLIRTAKQRIDTLPKGKQLVRARKGVQYLEDADGSYDIAAFSSSEIGAPSHIAAPSGRMNPKGIAFLYLADSVETAIAEVRPWISSEVSVGYFRLVRNLKVLNVTRNSERAAIISERVANRLHRLEKERYVWGDIDYALSVPVESREDDGSYIPTQYFSELMRNAGLDGIIYRSSARHSGLNVVLFRPEDACPVAGVPYQVQSIRVSSSQYGNPWVTKGKAKHKSHKLFAKKRGFRFQPNPAETLSIDGLHP